MATLLLVIIFIDFIGLGIPDSLFGAAWPEINVDFGLPISAANLVTVAITVCSIISSLASSKLINKFSTQWVAAVSTLLTAIGLFGFSVSPNMLTMCLFSLALGFGAGAIDSALNNYIAVNYKASHMNFLHCFYGIGVTVSPYLMSYALKSYSWRDGYKWVFIIQLCISVIAFLSLPLWKKVPSAPLGEEENGSAVKLSQLIKTPGIKSTWLVYFGSCGMEYTVGTWSSSFLVNSRGFTADRAALFVTLYYAGMALGRFLSGVISSKLKPQKIIAIGAAIIIPALVLVAQPFAPSLSAIGLFLIGLGNGPLYPNMVHLTPKRFGNKLSQSVMGSQMSVAYIGILSSPALLGFLAQRFTTSVFPAYISIFYAIMLISLLITRKSDSKRRPNP